GRFFRQDDLDVVVGEFGGGDELGVVGHAVLSVRWRKTPSCAAKVTPALHTPARGCHACVIGSGVNARVRNKPGRDARPRVTP
ncbi:hypothetical protein ACEN8K_42960, partial [Variovorax sp. CT11-76]